MSKGEGVEEHQVPPMLFEIEVETEGNNSPAEIERGDVTRTFSSPRPLYPSRFPFRTAKGFGNWMYSKLASSPDNFIRLHLTFIRYCTKFQMKKLVKFGKRMFHDYDWLCFLQGLFIVAVTFKQKLFIRRVFSEELEDLCRKEQTMER